MIVRSIHGLSDNGIAPQQLSLDVGLHVIAARDNAPEIRPFDALTNLLYLRGNRDPDLHVEIVLQNGQQIVAESLQDALVAEGDADVATAPLTDAAGESLLLLHESDAKACAGLHWLRLPYDAFCALARLNQQHLDALGDALNIERLSYVVSALADSGAPFHTATSMRSWLDNRIQFIGRAGAPGKPLTRLRNRCNALERELEYSRNAWRELRAQLVEHEKLEEELARLHVRRKHVEENLKIWDAHERAKQLEEAEALLSNIRELTQQCFSLSTARDFPTEMAPLLREKESRFRTAQMQYEHSLAEMEALMEKIRQHGIVLHEPQSSLWVEKDVPEELEAVIEDKTQKLEELGNRLEEVQEQIEDGEMRLLQAQERSAIMPDFSRFAADPIEWITQLTRSLEVAVRTRDEECAHRDQLQAEYDINKARNAHAASLFDSLQNFNEAMQHYEQQRSELREDQRAQHRQWQVLNLEYDEIKERMPGFFWMALACGLFFVMTLAAYVQYQNPGILISSLLMAVSFLYFTGNRIYAKKRLKQLETELQMLEINRKPGGEILADAEPWNDLPRHYASGHSPRHKDVERIENLLRRSGCESLRELEAMYDTYTEAVAMLQSHQEVLNAAKERAKEAEERVPRLLQAIQKTFQPIGIVIASEHEVKEASGNAIARYQEYREAKRRVNDYRSLLERHQQEHNRLMEELTQTRQSLAEAEEALLEHVKPHGFDPGDVKLTPLELLSQYKIFLKYNEVEADVQESLREEHEALTARLNWEEIEVAREEEAFVALLGKAGVKRLDEWQEKEALHKQYQEVWEERVRQESALDALLQGRDITELRERVQADSPLPEVPERPKEALRAEMHALNSAIEQREALYQEQQMRLTQRQVNINNLTLLEESLSWNRKRLDTLGIELEAATRALTLLDDAALATRREIIPGVVERIQPHMELISGGKYQNIHINQEFQIALQEHNASAVDSNAEMPHALLEQLYFGLRFALLQQMTQHKEPAPFLLDEAFAGYDDWQLERTLRLLQRMAGDSHQVLVYSTREDVVQAAEAVHAPVHYV